MENFTNLDAFKLNNHTIYHNNENRISCALNLLLFAEKQFHSAYSIKNLDKLKLISEKCSLGIPPEKKMISEFVDNALIDSIKISICFENYSKAILLSKGYLIHNIDFNQYKNEAKRQKKNPILIEDFPLKFYDDKTILTENTAVRKKISGLKDTTEKYSVILNNESYLNIVMIQKKLVKKLIELNKSRNSLHLQYSLSFKINQSTYNEYSELKDFVNNKIPERKKYLEDFLFGEGNTKNPTFEIKST
ncbi:hypothetical protein LNJ03_12065 [Tenacibaculum dicentrarchi]|nr:hypothetical protein [Tenacibaculum dicentrarchi]